MNGNKKTKTPKAAPHSKISPVLVNEVAQFAEYIEPARLSRNLRGLLLTMLIAQKDGYCFDLDDLLTDLAFLFRLLDTMEDTAV